MLTAHALKEIHSSVSLTPAIKEHYRKMRTNQTVEYVQWMKKKYLTFNKPMHVWDVLEELKDHVDVIDPELYVTNFEHLLQSAEGARASGEPDWMQLVALIHDLGKIIYLWGCDEDGTSKKEQWGIVGDGFIVGCRLPETCIYPEFNELNPDMQNLFFNTPYGMYEEGCGLDNCLLAWGHDEYLYQVLKHHSENRIPEIGMVSIRYHSFYPWHQGNSYSHLECQKDKIYKQWVRHFNQFDLYIKPHTMYRMDELKEYYLPIIEKYLGKGPIYW